MRIFTTLLAALLISFPALAGKKLKVLFIGNSYIYVNNLPQLVANVAASAGDTLVFDSYTIGGATFADHAVDPACKAKIKSQQWDYVVLQEQSQKPSFPTGQFFNDTYHWAGILDTIIANSNPCTNNIFYMTWGRKNGDAFNCAVNPPVCTYEGMDSLLNLRYRAMADTSLPPQLGAALTPGGWLSPIRLSQVSPVGAVWHHIRLNHPSIELYDADESHPSVAGTYAGACAFYVALFRKDPTQITFNHTLNATDAQNIRMAAKAVAYDSMSKWYIGMNDLRAQFGYSISGVNTLSFNNTSTEATSYDWSFGDGGNSTQANPVHSYSASGNYIVRLIAKTATCADTTYMQVNTTTDVQAITYKTDEIIVYPNPAHDVLNVDLLGNADFKLMDVAGRVVKEQKVNGNAVININDLSAGIYIYTIETAGGKKTTGKVRVE